jgi:MFS family permease
MRRSTMPAADIPPTATGERGPVISPNVKVLAAVSLAQDAGSEMLYPLLPTLLTRVLGAPVVAVGVAEGLADAVAAGMKLVAGRLAASRHRRRWIAAGYGLATIGKIIVACSFVWPFVLVGRVVDRAGKGIRGVPRDALIADETGEGRRGRAFGFHRAFDSLGAVIGPLIGLGLLELLDGRVRPALFVAIVPAAISVGLVGLVRQRPAATAAAEVNAGEAGHQQLPVAFWQVLIPLGLFAVVNSTDALLLQRGGELGLSVTAIVVAYILYNVVYAALGYPAGKLADRLAPRVVFGAGLVVFGMVYLGLGTVTSSTGVWVLLPCYGAYAALTDGVSRAWIANLVTTEQRTWALGVHGATTGIGVLVAGLWSGLLWHGTGRIPLTVSGSGALLIAAWLLLGKGRSS